jgi:membrane-associated protein
VLLFINTMQSLTTIFKALFSGNIRVLVEAIGLFGVYFVIFAESGLLIGFFLPGDSLLFTAGFLSSPSIKMLQFWPLVLGAWLAAVLGDNVGYEFGKRAGKSLFRREKSFLFNPENVMKAQEFYEKHGGKAITLARFMPVIRTFAPVVAGIGHMDHKKFTFFNFIGGTLWVWGMTLGGYFLGSVIPEKDVDKYLLPIILLIVLLSVLPPLIHLYRENKRSWTEKVSLAVVRWFKYKV